jgi:hypothetical protein
MNEAFILLAAISSFLFTDYCWDPEKRHKLGVYWLLVILVPLLIDGFVLFFATIWRAKDAAEAYIAKRKYMRIRKELIENGTLKETKGITAKE